MLENLKTGTAIVPILPLHVDSTMIACGRSCLQKFYREFVCGLRPPGLSIDLHAGGCFALALEVTRREIWENNRSLPEALLRAHAAFWLAWGQFEIPTWKATAKTPDRVWEAVEDYFAKYPPHTDTVKPYFDTSGKPTFEYTFAIPLEPAVDPLAHPGQGDFPEHPNGGPFIYTGRFDMLGSLNGRPVVCDEKTTGRSIGADWASQWQLRSQFMGYCWACQQCGIDVDTVVIRGTAIQKTQIVQAEAVQQYSNFHLERWHEQLRRDLWRIRRAWDEQYWDFNFADACTSYGRCAFLDSCSSITPESWLQEFEIRRWNPLDKNPAKVKVISEARAI